jgi:anti-sigma regulatory factor (Ser/Thr protein kinase)
MRLEQIGPAVAGTPPPAAGRRRPIRIETPVDVTIPLDVQAPGLARAVVARCLTGGVASSVLANAQLLVSELVTNSLLHSGAAEGDALAVRIHVWRDVCRIEVEDPGHAGVVALRPPDPVGGSGMGLNMVQTLSRRWGVVRASGGPTRVWAQLPCDRAVA